MSFSDNVKTFKDLITTIGTQKELLEAIVAGGSVSSAKQKGAFDALDGAVVDLQGLMANTKIPDQERKRRMAELQAEIDRIELLRDFEQNFEKRMELFQRQTRLNATLGTWEATIVFRFDTLLNADGHEYKTLLKEADKDIKARQNLQRVLKGIEVALSISAFGAALAAKLAASAV